MATEELQALGEEYVYDVVYVQAPSIVELNKKVRSYLTKEYEPESAPFLDTTVTPALWTQMMVQMDYDDGSEGK